MKCTEQQIREKAFKIMKDVKYSFLEDVPIRVRYEKDLDTLVQVTIPKGWIATVSVEENQFNNGEPGDIFITFDDETGEPVDYEDCALSRPIPQLLQQLKFLVG